MDEFRFELLPGDLTICHRCHQEYVWPAEDYDPNAENAEWENEQDEEVSKCPHCLRRFLDAIFGTERDY